MRDMDDNQLYAHQWRWGVIGFCVVMLSACSVINTRNQLKAPRIGTTTVTTTTIQPIGDP